MNRFPQLACDANEWRPTEARESIAHQELAIINADSMADIMARRKDARPVRRFDVASGLQPSPEAVKSRKNFKLIAVWKPNLQPDFNVSIFECFDTSSSAVLRKLDESNRFVQKSAESTSI